jgi:formylglycine-generating enzyme required for sulfatase activity
MSFNTALSIEDDEEVRNALLEHLWVRFLEAEEEKEKHESVRLLSMVELHDRMPYLDGRKRSQIMRERIKGDGTLTITSRHYPCPCLTEGRMVSPQELAGSVECRVSGVKRKEMQDSSLNTEHSTRDTSTCGMMGYHPFSGRALDGRKGAEGLPELEPKEPIHLKVHGPGCRTEALEGADVWLFKYEEKDKILIPVFPEGIEVDGFTRQVVPDDILDRCFDKGSPYRPGAGLHLGKTSVAKFTIPMGSYLLILHKEGSHPVRCPVYIGRLTDEEVSVTLYRNGEIPEGFIQVPAGRFIFQGDKENPYSGPKEVKETEDSFIARFPVTCREYVEFLNDLALRNPKEASMRVPRKAPTAGFYWPKDEKGRYHIPTEKWMARAPEIIKKQSSKLDSTPIWWEEDWPVFSLSWEDLMAYAAWRTGREDLLFSLPHEIQWEKSARGTDGRFYPWGKEMDATFCNSNQSLEEGMCPTTVHSFPADESPYGARGHCGNCRDMVLNDPGEAYTGWRMCRGGGWSFINIDIRPSARTGDSMSSVFYNDGGRLSWLPCSKTQKA